MSIKIMIKIFPNRLLWLCPVFYYVKLKNRIHKNMFILKIYNKMNIKIMTLKF